jgi:hypothetical protein
MTTPAQIILDHLEEVRAAFSEAPAQTAAWAILERTCPDLTARMAFNSFKVIAPAVMATAARLAPPTLPPEPAPGNFMGWTVSHDRGGRLRYHRRLGGSLRSIYVGKLWDPEKARQRIEAVEREFRHE